MYLIIPPPFPCIPLVTHSMSSLIFSHNILSTVSNVCWNTETLLPGLEQVAIAVVSSCLHRAPPILWPLPSFCPLFWDAPWVLAGRRVIVMQMPHTYWAETAIILIFDKLWVIVTPLTAAETCFSGWGWEQQGSKLKATRYKS